MCRCLLVTQMFSHESVYVTCVCDPEGQSGSPWKPACSRCSSSLFRWSLVGSSLRQRTKTFESALRLQQVSDKEPVCRKKHTKAESVVDFEKRIK